MRFRSTQGSSLISIVVAVCVLAIGVGTVTVMVREDITQQQNLAAQTQRATYTTFQSEVAAQGIDPTGIINPLSSVAATDTSGSAPSDGSPASLGSMTTSNSTFSTGTGGANLGLMAANSPLLTGERSGAGGTVIIASGTDVVTTTSTMTLLAPGIGLASTLLTYDSFPAAGWFTLPSNPVGTVYHYTLDGSDPTDSSPIWNISNAQLIVPANFPDVIKIRATHADTNYTASSVAVISGLLYQLDIPDFSRAFSPAVSTTVFTYAEQVGSPGNGVTLAAPATTAGIPTSIHYTYDGSDPSSSGTRITYTGAFKIPLSAWAWNSVLGDPATGTVRAAVIGPGGHYVNSVARTISFANQPIILDTPSFSISSAGGPVNVGDLLGFSSSYGAVATFRFSFGIDPTGASTAGTSYTF